MSDVLLLNASMAPLSIVNLARAVRLLIDGKAEIHLPGDGYVSSERMQVAMPSIIRLTYFVKTSRPYARVALTKKTVLLRDEYVCQYCGDDVPKGQATVDHVVPKSRGGPSTWLNLVCACMRCNNMRKRNRTPEEAGMRLLRAPYEPKDILPATVRRHTLPSEWVRYMTLYGKSI